MSDLIKRSDAIKALRKLGHEVVVIDKVCSLGVAQEFINVIRELPSADRPQGEWMPFEYGDERWHKCTACGVADRYIEYVERPNGTTGKLVAIRNFCPNCGARMKGADDE